MPHGLPLNSYLPYSDPFDLRSQRCRLGGQVVGVHGHVKLAIFNPEGEVDRLRSKLCRLAQDLASSPRPFAAGKDRPRDRTSRNAPAPVQGKAEMAVSLEPKFFGPRDISQQANERNLWTGSTVFPRT